MTKEVIVVQGLVPQGGGVVLSPFRKHICNFIFRFPGGTSKPLTVSESSQVPEAQPRTVGDYGDNFEQWYSPSLTTTCRASSLGCRWVGSGSRKGRSSEGE